MDKEGFKKKLLHKMITLYCFSHHSADGMCPECRALKAYAFERIENCPVSESNTSCSSCRIHCYTEPERSDIRRVMRYSGPRMIFHSPLLTIRFLLGKAGRGV